MQPLEIDGGYGEGGGQLLRTAVALAAVTRREIVVRNIRPRRRPPGVAPQHAAAVRAVAALCSVEPSVLRPVSFHRAGGLIRIAGLAHVAHLPMSIAERMRDAALDALSAVPGAAPCIDAAVLSSDMAAGTGGEIVVHARTEHSVLGASCVAERGVPAEALGRCRRRGAGCRSRGGRGCRYACRRSPSRVSRTRRWRLLYDSDADTARVHCDVADRAVPARSLPHPANARSHARRSRSGCALASYPALAPCRRSSARQSEPNGSSNTV